MRRLVLCLGALGVVATAPSAVSANAPKGALRAALYAGESHGGWACGPRAKVRYASAGLEYRFTTRETTNVDGAGFEVTGGAALELEQTTLLSCEDDVPCTGPPTRALLGAGLHLGYRWSYLGATGGVLAYQAWAHSTSKTPDVGYWPQLHLAFGRELGFGWRLGSGAPHLTAYRRPAAVYTGPVYTDPEQAWRTSLLVGVYRAGPSFSQGTTRFDFSMSGRLTKHLWLGGQTGLGFREDNTPFDLEVALLTSISH